MIKQACAVFEGGGVKVFGILGALYETERRGYRWSNVAGTSAGAIIASFIAAGYSAVEIKNMVWDFNLNLFKDKNWLGRIPYVGPALSLWFENGLYEGKSLENWIRMKLSVKGIHTFKDLVINEHEKDSNLRYRLITIATDVSRRKLLKLPHDLIDYQLNPDDLEVCKAVRMSAALPYFFKPYKLVTGPDSINRSSYVIDGGVLSNFPVWIFDGDGIPSFPTFGFKIVEPEETLPSRIVNPFSLFRAILSTMLEAHDKIYELNPQSGVRTISIPSLGVKTTDFDSIHELKEQLFSSGVEAAINFFERWDFESFKLRYYS